MADINELVAEQVAKQIMGAVNISSLTEDIVAKINVGRIAKALTDELVESIKDGSAELYLDFDNAQLSKIFRTTINAFLKEKLQ